MGESRSPLGRFAFVLIEACMVRIRNFRPLPPPDEEDLRLALGSLPEDSQQVRFVGGCVRDHLLGRTPEDYDLATTLTPDAVLGRLGGSGLRTGAIGKSYGTVCVFSGTRKMEITTLRRDVRTMGRGAEVAFTTDWRQDASRRDFTMNAMYMDTQGRVYDFFDGYADVLAGQVRFVGSPLRRVEEDYLRILRFFRFQALYGRTAVQAHVLRVLASQARFVGALSGERIWEELGKLLAAPQPTEVVRQMLESKILGAILPTRSSRSGSSVLSWLLHAEKLSVDDETKTCPLLRLAALLCPAHREVAQIASCRLALSRRARGLLVDWIDGLRCPAMMSEMSRGRSWSLARRMGLLPYMASLRLRWAAEQSGDVPKKHAEVTLKNTGIGRQANKATLRRKDVRKSCGDLHGKLQEAHELFCLAFPVRGQDVLDLGGVPGVHIRKLLQIVQEWWVVHNFPDRAQTLHKLKMLMREQLCVKE